MSQWVMGDRVSAEQIEALTDAVVAVARPDAVVLFGSLAYGTPTADSDVDLLVIQEYQGRSIDAAVTIQADEKVRAAVRFPLDLIVRSRSEVAHRIPLNDWFLKEITEQGITLYAADDAGVGRQGRGRLRLRLGRLAGITAIEGKPAEPMGPGLLPRPAVR